MNWVGDHSISVGYQKMTIEAKADGAPAFNFLFRILTPVVFQVLFIALFQALGLDSLVINSYWIVIYYWIVRVIVILLLGQSRLTNWYRQFLYWVCSIGLAIWIASLTNKVESILPDPQSLVDELWILIILFIYSLFNALELPHKGTIQRKNSYISKKYRTFVREYGEIVHGRGKDDFIEAIVYSVMIFEDFNRPAFVRLLENILFKLTNRPHTLGVMQVNTSKFINNKESVKLGVAKILSDSKSVMSDILEEEKRENFHEAYDATNDWYQQIIVARVAGEYNGNAAGYKSEILYIFEYLARHYYGHIENSKSLKVFFRRLNN